MSKKRSARQSACFHPSLTTSANFRDFRDVTIFQFEIAKFDLKTLKYYNLTRYNVQYGSIMFHVDCYCMEYAFPVTRSWAGSIPLNGSRLNGLIYIWVCLKIGYIPNYSHLIGIMIINHWV